MDKETLGEIIDNLKVDRDECCIIIADSKKRIASAEKGKHFIGIAAIEANVIFYTQCKKDIDDKLKKYLSIFNGQTELAFDK